MQRNKFQKVAIIAGLSECLVYAEAKYCAFEIHGEPKYYVCPKTEYCCNFGCCVSPGFQIYHIWYYWLLVIIMFLVCSGGGWWYRYWLQGRYRAAASAIPTSRSPNTRRQNPTHQRPSTCQGQGQQASISYNAVRNTVLLHRMWKTPNQRSQMSSAYAGNSAAGSANFQNTNVVLNDLACPYYQLYGPPPSYETVIAQTRAKNFDAPSNLLSPDRSIRSDGHSHCFPHNNHHSSLVNTDTHIGQIQMDNCNAATYFSAQPDNSNHCHRYRQNDDAFYNRGTLATNHDQQVLTIECSSQQTSGTSLTASEQHAVAIIAAPSPINPSDNNVILEELDNYFTANTTITSNTATTATTSATTPIPTNSTNTNFTTIVHNNTHRRNNLDNKGNSSQQEGSLNNPNLQTSNDELHVLIRMIESNKQKLDRSKSLD